MMNGFRKLWVALRSSLWFVPSGIVALGIILAVSMSEFDRRFAPDLATRLPRLFGVGAEGSRALLGAVATSMMTVTGVTFSITIVALVLASTQFSPRLLRHFMSNRTTQVVMGVFAAVFAYCLIVLRTIRGGEGEFVPNISVLIGIILALGSVWVLILFIHHIASSIQASTVTAEAAKETLETILKLFPEPLIHDEDEPMTVNVSEATAGRWFAIHAPKSGYVQLIDEGALAKLAEEQDVIFRMEHSPGDFVVKEMPILSVHASEAPTGKICRAVTNAVAIGTFRTMDQDPAFGIRQLVDIALKALSPGINDTTTAVNCIDYLGAILSELAQRRLVSRKQVEESRLILRTINFEKAVEESFNQIRDAAEGNAAVLVRMLRTIEVIASFTGSATRRRVLSAHIDLIEEAGRRTIESPHSRRSVIDRVHSAKALLESRQRP